jgi:hypothetical protein
VLNNFECQTVRLHSGDNDSKQAQLRPKYKSSDEDNEDHGLNN